MKNYYVITYRDTETNQRKISIADGIFTSKEEPKKICDRHSRANMLRKRVGKPLSRFTDFRVKKIV